MQCNGLLSCDLFFVIVFCASVSMVFLVFLSLIFLAFSFLVIFIFIFVMFIFRHVHFQTFLVFVIYLRDFACCERLWPKRERGPKHLNI